MPSLVKRDGSKAYNCPTGMTVNRDADELARRFIASAGHLTPAKEAELDNLLRALPRSKHEYEPTTNMPDPDVLAQLDAANDDAYSWMNDEPSNEALDAIDEESVAE